MNKLVSFIILLTFVMSSVGVVIKKHYSMGDLYDIAVFSEADRCCDEGCGCCTEDTHLYRIQDEYKPATTFETEKIQIELTPIYKSVVFASEIDNSFTVIFSNSDSPPGIKSLQSFLQSFRC